LVEEGGKFYWDIDDIFNNILKGLKMVADRHVTVKSIGIDTWGVDFVAVDKDGKLCGKPRSYRDPYSFAAQDEFLSIMPREELYRRTGIQIMNFNSVFQLYAQSKAGDLDRADKILFIPDALSYLLTGRMVCEYTILSTSAIMDPRTKTIDPEILGVCGLKPDLFPQIVFPGTEVGVLKAEIGEMTGLPGVPVVAVAGHDTGSVVAAVPAKDARFAYLSSGTWSLMGIETPEPVINEQMFQMNFTNEGGINGTTRLLKNITGMWILEQCLAVLRREGRDYSFAEIVRMAQQKQRSAKVFDPDDKCFASPTDMVAAIREYMSGHGWEAPADDAALFRLIYDSLADKYAMVFNKLKEVAPFEINTLHIVGGGSQNAFLNALTARSCGVKVVAGPAEGTALGNVMVQAGLSREDILNSINTEIFE
ncbi:MAG: rhamnulokinase family protein, partial [Candidatus Cryptobacteroides sp.]